jgi:hypothetical protein
MISTGGPDDFLSSELRAVLEQIRKQVLINVPTVQLPKVPTVQLPKVATVQLPKVATVQLPKVATVQLPRIAAPLAVIDAINQSIRAMDTKAALALVESFNQLSSSSVVGQALRASAAARARSLTPPEQEQLVLDIKAVTVDYLGGSGAQTGTGTPTPGFAEELAQATELDPKVLASVQEQLEEAVEADLDADVVLAPVRDAKLDQLTPAQTSAAAQLLNRWAWNFEFDHTVLSVVFGDSYLLEVVQWAAMLAVIQVLLVTMLLPPGDDEE